MILADQAMNPDFKPLEKLATTDKRINLADWMWMASYLVRTSAFRPNNIADAVVIQTYKHCNTRRYINLDGAGKFYTFKDGDYVELTGDISAAIHHAITF